MIINIYRFDTKSYILKVEKVLCRETSLYYFSTNNQHCFPRYSTRFSKSDIGKVFSDYSHELVFVTLFTEISIVTSILSDYFTRKIEHHTTNLNHFTHCLDAVSELT